MKRYSTIADWYHYANPTGHKNSKHTYKLPYDASEISEFTTCKLAHHCICLSLPWLLFDLSQKKWEEIKKVAISFGMSPIHKGKGKPGNRHFKGDSSVMVALLDHVHLGEPLATRIVLQTMCEVTEWSNYNYIIYLSMRLQKQFLYPKCCEGQSQDNHTTC